MPERCNCEHICHESPSEAIHPYMAENTTGVVFCYYVGLVCQDCADTHMQEFIAK